MDKFYSDKKEDLELVSANAYDFVLNGTEVGGGSIRIHDSKIQSRMFEVLGFSKEDADYRFGFMINAFQYGAPPHCGAGAGFDRIMMLLTHNEFIRDVYAFPMNKNGCDPLTNAPNVVDEKALKDVHIRLREEDIKGE
jgi:aspartyl-tRNA synthetase